MVNVLVTLILWEQFIVANFRSVKLGFALVLIKYEDEDPSLRFESFTMFLRGV